MKKILSAVIVAMMILSLTAAAFAATGLGTVISGKVASGNVSVEAIMCAVSLNSEGVIIGVDFDEVQVSTDASIEASLAPQTKRELGENYGMKAISPIGKEYYEQMDALEDWCIGKTVEEVLNGAVEDADLKAGCTVYNGNLIMALEKAVANAK